MVTTSIHSRHCAIVDQLTSLVNAPTASAVYELVIQDEMRQHRQMLSFRSSLVNVSTASAVELRYRVEPKKIARGTFGPLAHVFERLYFVTAQLSYFGSLETCFIE